MKSLAPYRRDFLIALLLLCLALAFFWPVVAGGRTLLPADIPYQYAPWSASAAQLGVSVPQNHLLADLILENYAWKQLILESISHLELPLWNPYLFAGVPFLAAGQHSALYPLSVVFLLLPLAQAYGVFTALQLFIACLGGYAFLRVLGAGRFPALLAGVVYGLSGFMLVSVAFSMVIAAACWLPWALAATELAIRGYDPQRHSRTSPRLLYLLAGSLVLGIQFLAGHVDTSYYILMVLGFYTAWRLVGILRATRSWTSVLPVGLMLLGMVTLGIGLAAVQLVPLFELVRTNFRQGSASYQEVVGWALPWRRAISFLIPDFFGNPSQHSYFDLLTFTTQAVTQNAKGQPLTNIPENIFGVKNYVESGSYLGILPLLLGVTALARRRLMSEAQRGAIWLFAALAIVSLLLAFGTPLYAVLFYGLPGYSQLHSPFRWIFPYTLSLSVLAGLGAQSLLGLAREEGSGRLTRLAGPVAMAVGLAGLAGLGLTLLFRDRAADLAGAVMQRSASLQEVFSGGAMLYSYEARNMAVFFVFVALAGLVLAAARSGWRWRGLPAWQPLALVVVAADLYLAFGGFNPATDPRLLEFTPGAIRFLQADKSQYRIMGYGDDKPMLANLAMPYGIEDARGYDSIIPKQYADYMGLIEGQGSLLYNRIGDVTWSGNLDSQLLDLLGVKYVVTNQTIPNAGFTLVYSDGIRIYRNEDVLPRAFVVQQARLTDPADTARWTTDLKSLNPRQAVLLEDTAALRPGPAAAGSGAVTAGGAADITEYSDNRVTVQVTLPSDGYLVLADSYFPGWLAQDNGKDATIWRADGNFRAVSLAAGSHTVTFKYSPVSLRLGLFASLSAGVILLLGLAVWGWRRFYREAEDDHAAKRVVKNAVTPMAANLINKGIDFAFAMLSLRLLGPEGAGRFGYAVNLALFFGIVTDFGLGVLATREVAKDRTQGNRYLTNTALVRVALSAVALLPLLAVVSVNTSLTADTVAVIALLWASLLPSGLASSLSYLFNAYERFEFPATVTVLIKVASTFLAAVVLLLGGGIVGLAAVSVFFKHSRVTILYLLVRRQLFTPRWEPDLALVRSMMSDAYPLMINNLLATVFFRIDVQILQPLKGDEVVGYYNAAYKWIDGLNIIPASLTLALFPLLSRYGTSAKESMLRAYQGSLRLLILVALPLCVGMWLAAEQMMLILGGGAYLPHSAIALRILVWFLPFSFINSVTQYVLIALNQQRFLTVAFVIGVVFNVCANLLLIPSYGYVAAATVTVASEIVLLAPFYYAVRKHLAPIPWLGLAWRPLAAAAAMAVVGLALAQVMSPLAAALVGGVVYAAMLLVLGAFGEDDRALVKRLLGR